jgi:hypothetical protein
MASRFISCSQFTQFLTDQQPVYDKEIIKDIRPEDPANWLGHVKMGVFDPFTGTQHTLDRFNSVFPNITKQWVDVATGNCIGTPCDKLYYQIGFGSTRLTYKLEEQNWRTQLLCFDNIMTVTKAQEQWSYIISDILRPTTVWVQSNFLRKRGLTFADNKLIANRNFAATQSQFTFVWTVVGDEETYFDCNIPPTSVFKLTPQMLQRLVEPLMAVGYGGKNPFSEQFPPMLELVTDTQTTWELDRLGGTTGVGATNVVGGIPSVSGNWRFEQWDAASKFWKYGFSGQLGNYTVRTDPNGLRFNFVGQLSSGLFRYQVVLPYKNVPSSGAGSAAGLKSLRNPDFDNAQYRISFVWHPMGIEAQTYEAEPINKEMPFLSRNFGGQWHWAMHDLGADVNGCVIENMLGNKGVFLSNHRLAIKPRYTEFLVAIFHKAEPSCVIEINTCNADPGYPAQNYNSQNTDCVDEHTGTSPVPINTTLTFTPTKNLVNGDYEIAADTFVCEGGPTLHGALSGTTTLAALVVQLNIVIDFAGTWAVASATTITLTGPCANASLPFLV